MVKSLQVVSDSVSLEERVRRVESLDLGPIMFKLVYREHDPISREKAEELEKHYKRFLILHLKNRSKKIVPNKKIDSFWHTHILDTQKYAVDCEHVFGYFLHHFPYFGMRGVEDAQHLEDAFAETRQLYEVEFGEPYPTKGADCQVSDCDAEQCNPAECHNIGTEFARPTLVAA